MTTAVTQSLLNLRASPDATGQLIETLAAGQSLTVLDTQGEWLHVQTPNGQQGYVSSAYVTLSDGTASAPPNTSASATNASSATPSATLVAKQKLNVRSAPQQDPANILTQVAGGTVFTALEDTAALTAKVGASADQNPWINVKLADGTVGYVSGTYVSFASADQTVTPVSNTVTPSSSTTTTAPVVQPVQSTTTTTTGTTGVVTQPGDLDEYFAYIATKTDTPPTPAEVGQFRALADQIGLPAPFDMLPTLQTNESVRGSLIINGFGPDSFAEQHWRDWYSATDGMHNGLDHIVPTGTSLLAVADGVIVGTQENWKFLGSNDPCIILWPFLDKTDANGKRLMSNVLVAYAHLSDNSVVQRHQVVKAGDVIGKSGYPGGQPDNAHLHLEVHLISGDAHLPQTMSGHPLQDYPNEQPFGAISPFNPLLFFSQRMIDLHLRVGTMKTNGGMPAYPSQFNFFSVAQYQYVGGLNIWNHLNQAWPNGIYDLPTLVTRAQGYTPFQPFSLNL